MTDIELYKEIGGWIRAFHTRDFFYKRLLKDFQHDCFLKLRDKETLNREYIKLTCKYYPWQLMRNTYNKSMKTHKEFVKLDAEGEPDYEYADYSTIPFFEFETPKSAKGKSKKPLKPLIVTYRNGESEEFENIKVLSDSLGLKKYLVLYRYIGKPFKHRYTQRKLSHIHVINYK